ncbi:tRNA pseudouridine(38-40) synthase TruA [Echinicola sediminis]
MKSKPYTYLFYIQYLGFRYHGWQKQPGVKTIQEMLQRSLKGWLGHEDFNILGAGRTDAGVSCMKGAFELFSAEELKDLDGLLQGMNEYLPDDIKLLSVERVGSDFNIIQDVKEKEYRYHFSFGAKPHPFSSPFTVVFPEALDCSKMQAGAKLFEGERDFRNFCTKPKPETVFLRTIFRSELVEAAPKNEAWEIHEPTYSFRVRGKGFLRNQVRLMMGALYDLGKGKLSLEELDRALEGKMDVLPLSRRAPARGLVLQEVVF